MDSCVHVTVAEWIEELAQSWATGVHADSSLWHNTAATPSCKDLDTYSDHSVIEVWNSPSSS